jgi:antitoxin ParD1/3/4
MEARMTVKTTLGFTDRHRRLLAEKVGQGIFSTQSAAVAAALEQMMQDEEEREVALSALGREIRNRMETPRAAFIDQDDVFAAARGTIGAARRE